MERSIGTGLSAKYVDMLAAVIGQMSDGYWENTPMMRGYWMFCDAVDENGKAVIKVSTDNMKVSYNKAVYNRFVDMSDDAVRRFFADKIKFLIKEEGIGPWSRDNAEETDYLSYSDPYRVKDCYYAYEVLKGRMAGRHPEYADVQESRRGTVVLRMIRSGSSATK